MSGISGAFMKLIIEADGGSRGNPGLSGSGAAVLSESGEVLREISEAIGIATNNVAEYQALIFGLRAAIEIDPDASIEVRMDSKLVIEQMSGRWKIKHPDMIDLAAEARKLILGRQVDFVWIPREQNSRADLLANRAMDGEPAANAAAIEYNSQEPSSIRAPRPKQSLATTLILVRHGRTELTEGRKISGGDGEDPDLSPLGRMDASEVAAEIARFGSSGAFGFLSKPTAVVSSPIKRAAQTASAIASRLGLDVELDNNLREIGFGAWDGLTNEEVFTAFEEEYLAWRGSYDVAPPKGESLRDFEARILQALEAIFERHRGETLVLVAHVMPIRAILKLANDSSVAGFWRTTIGPASISIARFWDLEAAEVICQNSTSHLS